MTAKTKTHWGSTLDDFLKEEGSYEEAKTQVVKEMIAWQIEGADQEADGADGDEPHPGGSAARPPETTASTLAAP